MKKWSMKCFISITTFMALAILPITKCNAQADEIQQLLLNIEKLTQFKKILKDMQKGYEMLTVGYNEVRKISQGNFALHRAFLDGLSLVNPSIKKYKKVTDIINCQIAIVREYKSSLSRFKNSGWLNEGELNYIGKVYNNVMNQSLKNLDQLFMVITKNDLKMNDAERLSAIDKISDDMNDKYMFLRSFNSNASLLSLQRARDKKESIHVKDYFTR